VSVALRPLQEADGARVLAWRNSPDVAAYMYSDHVISPEEHARWLTSALTAADRRFWIVALDDAPVGLANLARIDPANQRCEWAYYLADPAVRGRGVGAQVEFAMIEHVFAGLKLNKLWCEVLVENEAVWTLHESFGFRREALYRQHVWKGGRFQDVMGLGLLASDWAAARAGCAARLAAKGVDVSALVGLEGLTMRPS
jgi:UDP-4-amino-4,6-dideoxy-N-acetyl-beta-L-altrosamine N-acetyltransferase